MTLAATWSLMKAGTPGELNRLLVEVRAPPALHFEMAVIGGDGDGSLAFYIDGNRVADTLGAPVVIHRELTGSSTVLLMWESSIESGQAMIRQLP